MSHSEVFLKTENLIFGENDLLNLSTIHSVASKVSSRASSSYSTASILYPQRQIKYGSSPLTALTLQSSLPWLATSGIVLNNNFIQPFGSLVKHWQSSSYATNRVLEANLAYIIPLLINKMTHAVDKYQFLGCLESLEQLFQTYTPAIFYSSQIYDIFHLVISYIKHPWLAFDLYGNEILLSLIGRIFSSCAWLNLVRMDNIVQQMTYSGSVEMVNSLLKTSQCSPSQCELATGLIYNYSLLFNNVSLKSGTDQVFAHIMRMMCVLACVIDETALPSALTANLSAGSTGVSPPTITNIPPPSVIESLGEKTKQTNDQKSTKPFGTIKSPEKAQASSNSSDKSDSSMNASTLPKTTNNVYLGFFQNSSIYLKLYETAKVGFSIYKKSPSVGNYDRFCQLIKTTLRVLAEFLEAGLGVHEVGPHLDEILLYLKVNFKRLVDRLLIIEVSQSIQPFGQ